MKPLLKDAELQKTLEEKGYVTLPFLKEQEVKSLNDFYLKAHPDGVAPEKIDGIHMTTWCENLTYKKEVGAFLNSIYQRACAAYFAEYRTLNEVFIVKEKGGGTTFKVHQDWSVVDEKKFPSLNVWVPLHDVDEQSGGLWVLEGSHRINRPVRGSGYLFPDYSPFFDKLEKKATAVSLKAGEAIVFYLNVIHGSPPNLTRNERRATCFTVIPENAPVSIYYQPEPHLPLELYHPPDDFMYHYEHLRTETVQRPPAPTPAGVAESFVNKPVTLREIEPLLKSPKASLIERIKRFAFR